MSPSRTPEHLTCWIQEAEAYTPWRHRSYYAMVASQQQSVGGEHQTRCSEYAVMHKIMMTPPKSTGRRSPASSNENIHTVSSTPVNSTEGAQQGSSNSTHIQPPMDATRAGGNGTYLRPTSEHERGCYYTPHNKTSLRVASRKKSLLSHFFPFRVINEY